LTSLDRGELTSGLAEVAKIALIADAALFTELAANGRACPDAAIVGRAIALKAGIVARDPHERGDRKLLNLGHTLGHALESASDFSWRHGEAVAVGIAAVCRLSAERGWIGGEESVAIVRALASLGLPTTAPEELLRGSAAYLRADKKADRDGVDLVAIHGMGKVSIKRLSSNELIDLVRCGGGK
jgi:3-dehydroquinate synthase